MNQSEIELSLIQMERAALDRWSNGDPDGFLEISDPDVTYFDPFQRLNGLPALRALYDQLRGKVHIDTFEMVAPQVQLFGDVAVLTFDFVSQGSEDTMNWHTTEVYRQTGNGWKIVHTHWSLPNKV